MKSLIDSALDAAKIEAALIESEGVITPELEKLLDEVQRDIPRKVDHYTFLMDRLQANAESIKGRADSLYAAAKSLYTMRERMRERVKQAMTIMKKDELLGENFRFKVYPQAPKLVVDNELLIPKSYKEESVSWVLDKEKLMAALEKKKPVKGCHLDTTGKTLKSFANKGGA